MSIRIDKYISSLGLTSRRNVEIFLKENKVLLNNVRIFESGVRIDLEIDTLLINNKKITQQNVLYFMLNKPVGYVTTAYDELGRPTVLSLLPSMSERLYPVGRLDIESQGLVLLTNDGELTYRITHPRFHIPKTYHLLIKGKPRPKDIHLLANGVRLKDGITQPTQVTRLPGEKHQHTKLEMVLYEGRNRQIRRMCKALNLELLRLTRVAIGPIQLGDLPVGKYRELTTHEIGQLQSYTKASK